MAYGYLATYRTGPNNPTLAIVCRDCAHKLGSRERIDLTFANRPRCVRCGARLWGAAPTAQKEAS